MKNDKILITINNLEDIKKLQELGIKNYVFPLKEFCVGIPNTFLISEINIDGYLYINRVLDNEGIDKLKEIIDKLPSNIKGIIFENVGIIPLIKDLNIEKILYLSHFNTNSESIKIYLEYVDSVIVSTDITKEEIEDICEKIPNKLTLFVLGYIGVMYSRRLLLDNYSKYHKIPYQDSLLIDNTNHKFIVMENNYGTYFYHDTCFNGLELLKLPCKHFFINATFLNVSEIEKLLNGCSNLKTDSGFLYQETIYKLKGE